MLTTRNSEKANDMIHTPNKNEPDKKISMPLLNGKFAIINVPKVAPIPSTAAKNPKIIGKSEIFVWTKTVN